jgi:hypothetical protein
MARKSKANASGRGNFDLDQGSLGSASGLGSRASLIGSVI